MSEVTAFDPRTKERFGATVANNLRDAMNKADCIVIAADHSEFRRMSLKQAKKLMNQRPGIVDAWRIFDSRRARKLGFIYCGVVFDFGDI